MNPTFRIHSFSLILNENFDNESEDSKEIYTEEMIGSSKLPESRGLSMDYESLCLPNKPNEIN